MAEREGFEPSVALRQHMISNHAHSTTLPPLRCADGSRDRDPSFGRTGKQGYALRVVNGKPGELFLARFGSGSLARFPHSELFVLVKPSKIVRGAGEPTAFF